ncbi:hypothetical protein CQW23_29548 [Capsicum baccatum]|uniref:Reverse transcriptase Ty1/copia-type domain-containing protein n=1 Tax=Capsicum baccatum TaxID=33114 RepID=A0A2G2VJM8_CAPBA|nr:hypothetical protein CQW23_29548 [Capsicum baccatum]
MATVRCVIALATSKGWNLHQMDVHNAFLQGDLEEEVYMEMPKGFRRHEEHSAHDYSLFTLHQGNDTVILRVYVDDLLITGSSASSINATKIKLHQQFKMKDLGISSLSGAKPAITPLESNARLTSIEYDQATGAQDINFVVQTLSQFMQHPKKSHSKAATRVVSVTLIEMPVQTSEDQLLVMLFILVNHSYHGSPRSNTPFLGVLLKLSTEAWLQQLQNLLGWLDCFRNLSSINGVLAKYFHNTLPEIHGNFESLLLKTLEIYHCSGFIELPQSLGVQKKLVELNLYGCRNLKKLPNSIQMESLEVLEISNCPKLDRFPEISEDMHRLSELTLQSTGIRELPLSIGNLSGLTSLDLEHCEDLVSLPNSLSNLKNLQFLCIRGCKKLEKLPENIGDLQVLEELDARETAISQLPLSITKLGKLKKLRFSNGHFSSFILHQLWLFPPWKYLIFLNIQFCQNLNELSGELPPNLERLYADYYLASKSIEDLLINCGTLKLISLSLHGHEDTECEPVVLMFIQQFLRTCIKDVFHRRNFFFFLFDQVRIPKSFGYQFTNQRKVSIDLNPSWYNDRFMGFSIFFYSYGGRCSKVTLICKSDPERKNSLECYPNHFGGPDTLCFIYIPFKTWWHNSYSKRWKKPNDYCRFEVSTWPRSEACWAIRLEYDSV